MVSGCTSNGEEVGYWEVYDDLRVTRMGWELGYMGTFQSYEQAMEYVKEYSHLFEGAPKVFRRFTDKI